MGKLFSSPIKGLLDLALITGVVQTAFCYPIYLQTNAGDSEMENSSLSASLGVMPSGNFSSSTKQMVIGSRKIIAGALERKNAGIILMAVSAAPGSRSIEQKVISRDRTMVLEWVDREYKTPVNYKVFLGTDENIKLIGETKRNSFAVGALDYFTVYSWRIESSNKYGRKTISETFHFSIVPWINKFYAAPNPFKAGKEGTTFLFMMPGAGSAELRIYHLPSSDNVFKVNINGLGAGENLYKYDGKNQNGENLANGTYEAVLTSRGENGSVSEKFKFAVAN